MKEDYEKALEKLTLFFLSKPVPINGQDHEKQKRPGTSDQLLFRLQNKSTEIPLLVMYCLANYDDVIYSSFPVIPKITSANLCKPIHDVINIPLSFVLLNLESVERKGKNYKNLKCRE